MADKQNREPFFLVWNGSQRKSRLKNVTFWIEKRCAVVYLVFKWGIKLNIYNFGITVIFLN